MSGLSEPRTRNRARSPLLHYAAVLTPRGATAGRLAADRFSQRRRPTRPTMRALTVAPGGRLHPRR